MFYLARGNMFHKGIRKDRISENNSRFEIIIGYIIIVEETLSPKNVSVVGNFQYSFVDTNINE